MEIFSDNFCAIHMEKESIMMDKLIYIGTSMLNLDKLLMYDYSFNNLKKKYNQSINLLYYGHTILCLKLKPKTFIRI